LSRGKGDRLAGAEVLCAEGSGDGLQQGIDSPAGFGTEIDMAGLRLWQDEVAFIHDPNHGYRFGQGEFGNGRLGRILQQDDTVAVSQEVPGRLLSLGIRGLADGQRVESCGVDDFGAKRADFDCGADPVASRAGRIGDDGFLAAGQGIEQGALAAVGRACQHNPHAVDYPPGDDAAVEDTPALLMNGIDRGRIVTYPTADGRTQAGVNLRLNDFDAVQCYGAKLFDGSFFFNQCCGGEGIVEDGFQLPLRSAAGQTQADDLFEQDRVAMAMDDKLMLPFAPHDDIIDEIIRIRDVAVINPAESKSLKFTDRPEHTPQHHLRLRPPQGNAADSRMSLARQYADRRRHAYCSFWSSASSSSMCSFS